MDARAGSFAKWQAARARGATAPARLAVIGDSNVVGAGSGATGAEKLGGAWSTSLTARFAALTGYRADHLFGDQNLLAANSLPTYDTYDARLTLGSGWAPDNNVSIIPGGRFFRAVAGSAGKLRFTPGATDITKFRVYYPTSSGLATALTVSIDGTLVDTLSQVGSIAYVYRDYTVAAGSSHYIEVGGGATGNMYVAGFETFNGTDTPSLLQWGRCGLKAADLNAATYAWDSKPASVTLAADYAVIYCTVNDITAGTALQSYYASMEAYVSAIAATCDGCLVVGYPSNSTGTTNGSLDLMAGLLRGMAEDYDWSFVDLRAELGHSNTRTAALSYRFDDAHPNAAGAQAIADTLYDALSAGLA